MVSIPLENCKNSISWTSACRSSMNLKDTSWVRIKTPVEIYVKMLFSLLKLIKRVFVSKFIGLSFLLGNHKKWQHLWFLSSHSIVHTDQTNPELTDTDICHDRARFLTCGTLYTEACFLHFSQRRESVVLCSQSLLPLLPSAEIQNTHIIKQTNMASH